ncbi:MAG: phosphomannose isomerase type II C-terminal cupin domain [Patescibacteria group bacterium]
MEFKPFTIERPWGQFRQLTHNSLSTVKIHRVKPEEETSWQSHTKRGEFWHVVGGDGKIIVEDKEYSVAPGAEYYAPVGAKHRLIAGKSGMILVEVATGDFDEEDIIRYEDKYGRAQK